MTMKKIYKYRLAFPQCAVEMVKEARVVHVAVQGDMVHIWAIVDDQAGSEIEKREFAFIGTGLTFDAEGKTYIGTILEGPFVWHIFEVAR